MNERTSTLSLVLRNLLFTLVVPVSGAVLLPRWVLTRFDDAAAPTAWPGVAVMAFGVSLYLRCVWVFAAVGRGTPGPWDAPRHFVAVGPYRWVRNPIYISALLVVMGEAWLFLSPPLLVYARTMATTSHTGSDHPRTTEPARRSCITCLTGRAEGRAWATRARPSKRRHPEVNASRPVMSRFD